MSGYKKYFLFFSLLAMVSCKQAADNSTLHPEETKPQVQETVLRPQENPEPADTQASAGAATETAFPEASPNADYSFTIIQAEADTYGYEILREGKPMIRQATIPGMPGNKGFTTQADAEKVANLVVSKLKKGEMPPSVTPEEMKQLQVIK